MASQDAWWTEFTAAWQVMTEFTYPGQLMPPVGEPVDPAAVLREHGVRS